ncbi:cytochrome C oxidase assembly factor 3b [Genypterus blacodes]|uniref:cytochrome C oxidase assembly factor 3b n=1 Tax=Genypterus blacodes TaxID=154954 RepID=UPI003F75857D
MADQGGEAVARTDPSAAQRQLHRRRQELDNWQKYAQRLRRRNLLTGLAIGAFVVSMFSYTILSVKQERIMDELDDEARTQVIRGPRTGANS